MNDVVTDTTDTCSAPPRIKLTSVTGGVPTAVTLTYPGECSSYTMGAISTSPYSGSMMGSGLQLANSNLSVLGAAVTSAGYGYVAPPVVTLNGTSGATATSALSGSLQLTAGGSTLNLATAGATIAQMSTTPYSIGVALIAGELIQNGGNLYKITNVGCTTANPTGPVNTMGSSALDGCTYSFIPSFSITTPGFNSAAVAQELSFTDQGGLFSQPACFGSVDAVTGKACVYSGVGAPGGLVTAVPGSLDLVETGAAYVNVSAGSGGTSWLALLTSNNGITPPLPVPPVWRGSDQPMPRAACGITAAGQITYYPFWIQPSSVTVTKLGISVTAAAGTGGAVRLGIYADNGTASPSGGALKGDFGEVAITSVGTLSTTALSTGIVLGHGLWWIAAQNDSIGAPSSGMVAGLTCVNGSLCWGQTLMGGSSAASGTALTQNVGLLSSATGTTGLPPTPPGPPNSLSQTSAACIPAVSMYVTADTP